jgi:hypothetical protein
LHTLSSSRSIADSRPQIDSLYFTIKSSMNYAVLSCLYIFCLLLSYVSDVYFGKSYVHTWPNDVMGLIDSAYRVFMGQVPYIDFHLFYGPLVPVIPALGLALGLKGGVIFGFDAVVVAAIVLLAAAAIWSHRLTLPAAALAFIFLWLLIVVPLGEGLPFSEISWGTYYNRHAWAAFIALLVFYVEPDSKRPSGVWIDAVSVAVLVMFNIYTKISFGMMSFGFLVATLVVSKYHRAVAVRAIASMVVAAAVVEMLFRFHAAYVENIIEFISSAAGSSLGLGWLLAMLISNAPIIFATFAALGSARAAGRRVALDILFVLGCIAASILIRGSIGDNNTGLLVALIAVPLCLGELARRAEVSGSVRGWRAHLASVGCLMLAFIFMVTEAGNRVTALAQYTAHVAGLKIKKSPLDIGALPGATPALANFLVSRDGAGLFDLISDGGPSTAALLQAYRLTRSREGLATEEYMRTVVEGAELLKAMQYTGRTVFTFDMVNPFPYVVGMRAPEHGYPLFWLYSTNRDLSPAPEQLLGAADFVMMPRLPFHPAQLENMLTLYGDYLRLHFEQVKTSPHWQVLAPKMAACLPDRLGEALLSGPTSP